MQQNWRARSYSLNGKTVSFIQLWSNLTVLFGRYDFIPFTFSGHEMQATQIFEEIQSKVSQLLANSPAKDIEKNVRGLMQQGFEKLDLATREQLDLQAELLARTRAKLTELETRVAELEGKSRPL